MLTKALRFLGVQQPRGRPPKGAPKVARTVASASADSADGPWLIAGLGNPGPKYENTRHNVGFMVIDALSAAEGIPVVSSQNKALVGKGKIAGKTVILAKPQTYMNASGEAIGPLMRFYKVVPTNLLVIYDDLDLDVAAVRLKKKGSHGGQNGMRSIISCLGNNQDFPRLRIGIGRPPGSRPVPDHVLSPFDKRESAEIQVTIAEAQDVIRNVLANGMEKAMNSVNGGAKGEGKAAGGGRPGGAAGEKKAAGEQQKGKHQPAGAAAGAAGKAAGPGEQQQREGRDAAAGSSPPRAAEEAETAA